MTTVDPRYRMRKRWLIKADAQLKIDLSLDDCDWEVFGGNECLRLFPTPDTQQSNDYVGGNAPKINFTGSGTTFVPAAVNKSFKLKIADGRRSIWRAVRTLSNRSISSGFSQLVTITVFDFVFPEEEDEVAASIAGTEACTQRQGLLILDPPGVKVGGSVGDQYQEGGGFTFSFQEASLRLVV